jgi:hypothetical protein
LDTILENDILMIVRENVRPVRLLFCVVGSGPKFTKSFGGKRFHNALCITPMMDLLHYCYVGILA